MSLVFIAEEYIYTYIYICKNFLKQSLTFTSPKTSQIYRIKSHINCNTKNIINLILDLKCPDIFYVGYTTDCMAVDGEIISPILNRASNLVS